MNRNIQRISCLLFGLLLLISVFSCSGLFITKRTSGSISVILPSANSARNAGSNHYAITDIASLKLTLTPEEGEPVVKTPDTGTQTVTFDALVPGIYSLTVEAFHSNGFRVVTGTCNNIIVVENETTEVPITMQYNHLPYSTNSCYIETQKYNPALLEAEPGATSLSFNVSEESPLVVTDGNQVTRAVTSLDAIDITNYESGNYSVFLTADDKIVLIRDYAEDTDFAAAFSVTGSPTIDADTGAASGFSTANYLKMANQFEPRANTWEFVTKITTTDDTTNHQTIKGSSRDCHGFYVCFSSAKFSLCAGNKGRTGSNGGPWSFTGDNWYGAQTVQRNTTYYFRTRYTGTAYTLEISSDGITWNMYLSTTEETQDEIGNWDTKNWGTIDADIPIFGCTAVTDGESMQLYANFTQHMYDTYFKINGEYYWTGEYGYTSAARMDTSGERPVLKRMTENGPVVWDAVPLNSASVNINDGTVSIARQPSLN